MVPRVCIYCKKFPCVGDDDDKSVVTELDVEYPYKNEHDDFKPCRGEEFEAVDFSGPEPPVIPLPAPATASGSDPAAVQVLDIANKYVKVVIARTAEQLEYDIDSIVQAESVTDYEVVGFASTYDIESQTTKLAVVLEVWIRKENATDMISEL